MRRGEESTRVIQGKKIKKTSGERRRKSKGKK